MIQFIACKDACVINQTKKRYTSGKVYFKYCFIFMSYPLILLMFLAKLSESFEHSLSLRRHAHGPLVKHLMHMEHKSGKTSGVSKSSSDWLNYTRFPGDVCVAFFNVLPGNKDAMTPNSLTKEESHRVYNCDDECLSGSTKCWIFKSM